MTMPHRVLLAGSSPEDAARLIQVLTASGIPSEWKQAASVTEMRLALTGDPWDVVLVRAGSPDLEALSAVELLRELDPVAPCLVIADSPQTDQVLAWMRAGATDCLEELVPAGLADVVSRAVRDGRRKRQVEASHWRLAAIISDADHSIVSQTLDGIITTWNAGAERLYGYAAAEMIGRSVHILLPPGREKELAVAREKLLRGEFVPAFETVRRHRSGRLLEVSMGLSPVRDDRGRLVEISGIGRDISERRRLVVDLRERVKELRVLHRTATVLQGESLPPADLIDKLVDLLPDGWKYPEVAAARITWGGLSACSAGFVETPWRQSVSFTAAGHPGTIEVVYLTEQPPEFDGPFLAEEQHLLDSLAEMLRAHLERRQAIESLRHSEEHLRNLLDRIPLPLFVYDRETLSYLLVNDAAVAVYGYTRKEFLEMTVKDIRPADDVPRLLDMLGRTGLTLESRGVWRHRKKNGALMEVEITAHAMDFDGRPACIVLASDVTEQRRAEAELRRITDLLRAVADSTTDAVFVKDLEGRYLLCNPAAAQFMGRSAEEIIGRTDEEFFAPESIRLIMERDREVRESGQAITQEEELTTHGVTRTFLATKAPYRDQEGRVAGVLGISRDITDRKRLEQQFLQAQKMEAVGLLAGGIAHDFNNLLTVINGYCDLLLEQAAPEAASRDLLQEIRKAGDRAAALTRQLLAFSRQQVLEPKLLNLNEVIRDAGRMLNRLIGEDILLTTSLKAETDLVKADPGQIEQVLINLAVNARDAMPRGGRLTIETQQIFLDETYCRSVPGLMPGYYVLMAVTDTGCGMDASTQARIFEPFYTTKRTGHGTGLGLATVHGIIRQSRGHISVYSEIGHGTTFKIYLPLVEDTRSEMPPRAPRTMPTGSETLLLVEDEDALRAMSRHILSSCGYTVLDASNGPEALQLAERHSGTIDLLVTDVVMPLMSGRELAGHLHPLRPDCKVLFLSGYTDDAIIRHGVLEAEVAFLQKPFTPASLVQKVREVLDSSRNADR